MLVDDAIEEYAVVGKDTVRVEGKHELLVPGHLRRLQSRVELKLRAQHYTYILSIWAFETRCQSCGLIAH